MPQALIVVQIVISILLVGSILLQARGAGLGRAWGGGAEFYRSKRGLERILFGLTIVLATLFLLTAILGALLAQ